MSIPGDADFKQNACMAQVIFRTLRDVMKRWLGAGAKPGTEADWLRDPLSHPDIARMSARERADLQFRPDCVRSE